MSKFQKKIIKQYEDKGYCVLKLAKTNKNGIADLLVAKRGEKPFFCEVKEKNDTLKPLQIIQTKRVAEMMGFDFIVLRDGEGLVNYDGIINKTDLF